jgi:hypothetical protein
MVNPLAKGDAVVFSGHLTEATARSGSWVSFTLYSAIIPILRDQAEATLRIEAPGV